MVEKTATRDAGQDESVKGDRSPDQQAPNAERDQRESSEGVQQTPPPPRDGDTKTAPSPAGD